MTIKDMPHVTVEQVLALRDAAIELEQERNELAAQVERLSFDSVDIMRCLITIAYKHNHRDIEPLIPLAMRSMEKITERHGESPPQAIVALKAQWQAEAFNESAEICEGLIRSMEYFAAEDALHCAAAEIRQRAQEHNK